jgi:hypothetical protein
MFVSVYRPVVGVFLFVFLLIAGCSGGGGGNGNRGDSGDGGNGGGGGSQAWLISTEQVVDGGPGVDGIPAIENPSFEPAATIRTVPDDDLVIVVQSEGLVKAYPHDILDYHEIINDGPEDAPFTLSYCPLTGSALAWHGNTDDADRTYGVSGLLFNSNLLLYDRATRSLWSQMLQISVTGERIGELPRPYQVLEMRLGTLKFMYPDALVMTRATGYIRDYGSYPYGSYLTNTGLLFPVAVQDNRRHPKERVIGIHDEANAKVYQLSEFGDTTLAINDQYSGTSIVVVGNSALHFAAIYDRELADGTILSFEAIQDDLPNVLIDTEGNVWDIFGTAVSGPRVGQQLRSTTSYVAMWFAWAAHFGEVQLHFN